MKAKWLLGVAALTLSGAAIAQDTPMPQSGASTMPSTQESTPMAPAPTPAPGDPGAMPTPPAAGSTGTTGSGTAEDPNAAVPSGEVPADAGMAPADPSVPADPSAPVGSSANPAVVGGNATPAPAPRTHYPVCSKTVQDSCINPGEAKRARKH